MKREFVPEGQGSTENGLPYSLSHVCQGGTWGFFSGVIKPGEEKLEEEILSVIREVCRRVKAAGFDPDDIIFLDVLVEGSLNLGDQELVAKINQAYVAALKEAGVAVSLDTVLPCRKTSSSLSLMAGARFEATPVAWKK